MARGTSSSKRSSSTMPSVVKSSWYQKWPGASGRWRVHTAWSSSVSPGRRDGTVRILCVGSGGDDPAARLVHEDRVDREGFFGGVVAVGNLAQRLDARLRLNAGAHPEVATPRAVRLEPHPLVQSLRDQGLLRVFGHRRLL